MLIKIDKHLAKIINNHLDQSQVLFSHQMKYRLPLRQLLQALQLQHGSTCSFKMVLGVMSIMLLLLLLPACSVDAAGYSYTRFVGPVVGPEHKVFVNDAKPQHRNSGALHFDYVGRPEYEFAYGVEDANAHILHNRNEMRDGDAVKGVYSLIDPDGTLRVVKYTADEINGFQAEVIRNGVSSSHGQLQHDYTREPPPNTIIYNHDDYYNLNHEQQHHYPQPQTNFKDDRVVYYQSSNAHKPKLEQMSKHKYEKPTQPPIIYHYSKNYDDDDDSKSSNEGDTDYHDDQKPHYEVHEKPEDYNPGNQDHQPHYKVHEKPDDNQDVHIYDENGNTYKSHIYLRPASYKMKKHHHAADSDDDDDDDDNDDDDDYYGEDDSEENFDGVVKAAYSSEESREYY